MHWSPHCKWDCYSDCSLDTEHFSLPHTSPLGSQKSPALLSWLSLGCLNQIVTITASTSPYDHWTLSFVLPEMLPQFLFIYFFIYLLALQHAYMCWRTNTKTLVMPIQMNKMSIDIYNEMNMVYVSQKSEGNRCIGHFEWILLRAKIDRDRLMWAAKEFHSLIMRMK